MVYMQKYLFLFFIMACSVTVASMDPSKLPPKKRFRVGAAEQMTRASVPGAVKATTQAMTGLPSGQSAPAADGTSMVAQLSVVAQPALLPNASSSVLVRKGSVGTVLAQSKQQDSSLEVPFLQALSVARRAVELFMANARTVTGHNRSSFALAAAVASPSMVARAQGPAHVKVAAAAKALPATVKDGIYFSDSAQEEADRARRDGSSRWGIGHLKCHFCPRRYQQEQSLRYHELRCPRRLQGRNYLLRCRIHPGCPERFTQEALRIKHEQQCRWNGQVFLCPVCKRFRTVSVKIFAIHLQSHLGKK